MNRLSGFGCLLSFAVCGCEPEFSGFDDLLDPGPTYVNLPGRRVAEGKFRDVRLYGTDSSGAYLVARDEDANLFVTPMNGGQGCFAGPSRKPQRMPQARSSSLPLVIPRVENVGDSRRLSFVDTKCRTLVELGGNPSLTTPPFALSEPGFLARDEDAVLWFLSPWSRKVDRIDSPVKLVRFTTEPNRIWTLQEGVVVVRNSSFEIVARYGKSVTELVTWEGPNSRAAYIDDGALYVVGSKQAQPEPVETGACNVAFPDGWGSAGLTYFSPCDERQLILRESSSGSDLPTRHVIVASLLKGPLITPTRDPIIFFSTSQDPKAGLGALYGGRLSESFKLISERAPIETITSVDPARFRMIVDIGDSGGRLVEWTPNGNIRELNRGVFDYRDKLAYVDYDGSTDTGSVARIGSGRILATGVPPGQFIANEVGMAILSDAEDGVGTLIAAPEESNDWETIATNVVEKQFALLGALDAVAYVRDFDAEAKEGVFGVRVLRTADTFDLGTRVDNWDATDWPSLLLIYTVPRGQNRGIWAADIR